MLIVLYCNERRKCNSECVKEIAKRKISLDVENFAIVWIEGSVECTRDVECMWGVEWSVEHHRDSKEYDERLLQMCRCNKV